MFDTAAPLRAARALDDPRSRIGAITGLMADAIIDLSAANGDCSVEALVDAGFTTAEIAELGRDAVKLAEARAVRVIERPEIGSPAEAWAALKALAGAADRHGVGLDREGQGIMRRARAALDHLRVALDIPA